ncbi:type I toxin-antitoxin system Fst family toxin [Streptococcus suis]|uniref:Type I toxin-antitoxin system Fst family toxin n=1 Tax=Streptococcus suis TaxID=1307 RepID=A0A540UUU1_STRSU|nr:type I toxin-antitoxin system Fst family toxin [Streptococcus suis]TQE88260.1 type I toxin-antitoxin system Fst family toxin [Streptococcus suis]
MIALLFELLTLFVAPVVSGLVLILFEYWLNNRDNRAGFMT